MSQTMEQREEGKRGRRPRLSPAKRWAFVCCLLAGCLLLFEVASSALLLYRYRSLEAINADEPSSLSSLVVLSRLASRLGLEGGEVLGTQKRRETEPSPFLRPDPVYGYSARPGSFTHKYFFKGRSTQPWREFHCKVTINADGSRWTGHHESDVRRPRIYVLGDSWVFGTGVNDEQTFSALLQQARPEVEVKLFALGGYSLTQGLLRVESLLSSGSIIAGDRLILGYADFYDKRHAAATSWVRHFAVWAGTRNLPSDVYAGQTLPRAALGPKGLELDYIPKQLPTAQLDQPDPSKAEMTAISAAIINRIAELSPVPVHLVHISGDANNKVFTLLRPQVVRISATPGDFDYEIRDSVGDFDDHPGPYWHYAIAHRLHASIPK